MFFQSGDTMNFQDRVQKWVRVCFGDEVANDKLERCYRFLEEALELVQSLGMTREQAHTLVDYVFNRAVGRKEQELGGVMVTLAALSAAANLSMDHAGERELSRVVKPDVMAKIRRKQAAKIGIKGTALPGIVSELTTLQEYNQMPPESQGYVVYMEAEHPGSELKGQMNSYGHGTQAWNEWNAGNRAAMLEAQDGEE